jgi:hypothetical protein
MSGRIAAGAWLAAKVQAFVDNAGASTKGLFFQSRPAISFAEKFTMEQSEKFTTRSARWITPVFFGLVFYTLGASVMDSFAMYHTWRFVGPAEFAEMHKESGSRIVPFFVLPTMVMTVFLILQFWHRPKSVSRTLVWATLVCTIIPWLSSAFIQIPMQMELDKGKNDALLESLILTDWIRVVPSFVLAALGFTMMKKALTS